MSKDAESVTVIGASGAGLFAAWRLATAGRRVVVYEQRRAPRWASRTLIVTDEFRRWWPGSPAPFLRHRITAFELRAGSARLAIPLRWPDWVIERAELLSGLAQMAQDAGAEIRWGWRFLGAPNGDLAFVGPAGRETEVPARVVLAADGVGSRVGQALGLPPLPSLRLLQAQVPLPRWARPEQVVVWFDPTTTPYFYWLIPESSRSGVFGLIAGPGQPVRALLEEYLDRLGLEPLTYQEGMVATYRPGLPFQSRQGDRWVLRVGDAGGQVKVTTVGGTVTGLWGAAAVADLLLGRGRGTAWALEAELLAHWIVRRFLDRFSSEDYERLLRGLNRRSLRWLATVPRDRLARSVWRLLLAQPALLGWGLRVLFKGDRKANGVGEEPARFARE